ITPEDDSRCLLCRGLVNSSPRLRSLLEIDHRREPIRSSYCGDSLLPYPRRSPVLTYGHNVGCDHRREGKSTFLWSQSSSHCIVRGPFERRQGGDQLQIGKS